MPTFRELNLALATAERELDQIATQAKEAYRKFRALDAQQTVKADEIRELRQQIRQTAPEDRDA